MTVNVVARTSTTRAASTINGPSRCNLDCTVNSAGEEFSPFLVEYDAGSRELYFSSTRAGGFSAEAPGSTTGDADLYVSDVTAEGVVSSPVLVAGVNTAVNDFRPSLRRDGLELFFDSNRPGSVTNAAGSPSSDNSSASRDSRFSAWTVPEPLGPSVNTPADETRPFLTWDRLTLFFGRAPGTEATRTSTSRRGRRSPGTSALTRAAVLWSTPLRGDRVSAANPFYVARSRSVLVVSPAGCARRRLSLPRALGSHRVRLFALLDSVHVDRPNPAARLQPSAKPLPLP